MSHYIAKYNFCIDFFQLICRLGQNYLSTNIHLYRHSTNTFSDKVRITVVLSQKLTEDILLSVNNHYFVSNLQKPLKVKFIIVNNIIKQSKYNLPHTATYQYLRQVYFRDRSAHLCPLSCSDTRPRWNASFS